MKQSRVNPMGIVILNIISTFPLATKQHATMYPMVENRKAVTPKSYVEATNPAMTAMPRWIKLLTIVRFTVHTPIATAPMTNGIIF